MEGVRDHIVSSLHGKSTTYEMWKALTDLFQSSSDHRKLALKDKIKKIKMEKKDIISVYLTKLKYPNYHKSRGTNSMPLQKFSTTKKVCSLQHVAHPRNTRMAKYFCMESPFSILIFLSLSLSSNFLWTLLL